MRELLYVRLQPLILPCAWFCSCTGPGDNAKIASTLTQSTFVARVLIQCFTVARYYFVISAHFSKSAVAALHGSALLLHKKHTLFNKRIFPYYLG